MREIKFRGDDKEFEKMTYFDDEEYDYRPPLAFRLDQVFKKDSNYDDYEDFKYNDITDKLEIMQYTGLHDKNGKEIYEGDIIHINDSFFEKFNYLIEWNKEYLRYYLYSIDTKKLNKIGGILEAHLGSMINKIEVIGNIYENKELLNT